VGSHAGVPTLHLALAFVNIMSIMCAPEVCPAAARTAIATLTCRYVINRQSVD
jgi:hypothetical protein